MAKYRSQAWRDAISKKVTKLTPEVVQKLREAFLRDCTVEEACYYADVIVSTYYNWIKRFPELLEEFNDCRNRPVLKAREVITNALEAGDRPTASWYLTKKVPDEFGEKSKVEVTTPDGDSILTPEEQDPEAQKVIRQARIDYLETVKGTLKTAYKNKPKKKDE